MSKMDTNPKSARLFLGPSVITCKQQVRMCICERGWAHALPAPGWHLSIQYHTGARKTEQRDTHMVLAYLDVDIGDPAQHSKWDSEYALSSSFYARTGPQVCCSA